MLADRRLETSYNMLTARLAKLARMKTDINVSESTFLNVRDIKYSYNQVEICEYLHSGDGKTSLAAN